MDFGPYLADNLADNANARTIEGNMCLSYYEAKLLLHQTNRCVALVLSFDRAAGPDCLEDPLLQKPAS